ncbi:PREDICTED: uncharacterized protein LOC109585377 [Amphimedon queenslandica]|uniref:Uncharacterized protein n=1 Tax=Amphimedon queenslandica TaxID=400682 RepID=A0A1X7TZE3_AMPQE|nr:PREDICTED: uncharacterized protein LOC109585377 [Amphimedon queenslandica]|eukprot:XP_019856994.1 PREDICTED: uncharacterized protein LOC109585377 [Amphimedon queenslandica]
MAERASLSPLLLNKGLIVLKKFSVELQKELGDPSKLFLPLSQAGIQILDDYHDCYPISPCPIINAYHLLNGIKMAVHRNPDVLFIFLEVLDKASPHSIAKKIEEEYKGHDDLCFHPRNTSDSWAETFVPSTDRLINLQSAVKTELLKAKVFSSQIKKLPFLASFMQEEWEDACNINDLLNIIFKHCSPSNYSILLPLIGSFQLTNASMAIQAYENEQQHYCKQLADPDFIEELERHSSSSAYRASIVFGFPLEKLHCMTVSEFKLILSRIFSDFSCFIHITRVSLGTHSSVTLSAPERMSQCLLNIGLQKREYISIMTGATSMVIGDSVILSKDTDIKQMLSDLVEQKRQREVSQTKNTPKGLSTNVWHKEEDTTVLNQGFNDISHSKTTICEQPIGKVATENEEIIQETLDEDIEKPPKVIPKVIKAYPDLCKTLEKKPQQLKRERLRSWRRYKPEPRDVLIIGSFGQHEECSKRHIVSEKIIPEEIDSEWMKKEVDEIEKLYAKNPDTFIVRKTCRDYSEGQFLSRDQCLQMIKDLFTKYDQPGASIWYTGHGEKDTGNWCFKDGVISFDDIFHLYMDHYQGKSLTIISDCSHSGNWVKECAKKLDEKRIPFCGHQVMEEGIFIKIIASCQSDKEATALSFITEGVHYDEEEKGVIHCPENILKSGQKPSGMDFRNIRCSCSKKDDPCRITCNMSWSNCVSSSTDLIYTIHGEDEDKEKLWHCILVDKEEVDNFKSLVQSGERIDVSKYGEIICSGWGVDLPKSSIQDLELRFLK